MVSSITAVLIKVLRYLVLLAIVGLAIASLLIFGEPVDHQIVINTLLLGTGTSLLSLPVALLLAQVCRHRGAIPTLVRWCAIALLFMPVFLHVSAWDSAVGKLGWLSWTTGAGFNVLAGRWPVAIWIHSMAAIPQLTVILWFGMLSAGRVYEEQATMDANKRSVFWYVSLPQLLPVLLAAVVWVFITCAREIAVTDIYRIGTLAEQLYLGYSLGEFDATIGNVTIISMIVLASGLVVAALLNLDVPEESEDLMVSARKDDNSTFQTVFSVVMLLLLAGLPFANLLVRASRYVDFQGDQAIGHYSIGHVWTVVSRVPEVFAAEIGWSSMIAIVSMTLSITIATLAYWLSISSRQWKILFLVSVAICSGLPGPLIGSLLLWLRSIGDNSFSIWLFDRTIFAPVVANILFCWPVCSVLVWFVLRNTSRDSLEQAKLEGVGYWSRLLWIVVAGNKLGLCGVALIVFGHSFGELSASQLAVPPGMDTVPRRMLGMLHSGVNDHTAGLTIAIVGFIIVTMAVGSFFVRLNRRRDLNPSHSSQ